MRHRRRRCRRPPESFVAVAGKRTEKGKLPGYRVLNYWGYREGFYYAPKAAYAAGEDPAEEFRLMVKRIP